MGYKRNNNYLFDKSGHVKPPKFIEMYQWHTSGKISKKSDDTKIRELVLQEIEQRCSNGENLETVAEEIANREEIQEHFSYYAKNNIETPLKNIFINWYNSKQKSYETNNKINRWWENK